MKSAKQEFIFIVNPNAGKQNADEVIERINKACRKRGVEYQIIKTEYPKHASEIAKNLPKQGKVVFSVGGDGTLNEVLQGVAGTKNILGVIPNGTGNDFYYTLSKLKGQVVDIDLGIANNKQYFIGFAGIGFDTEVTIAVNQFRKKFIPVSQRFTLAITKTLATFRPVKINFHMNGSSKDGEFMIVTAGNARRMGGKYLVWPEADMQDGLLDICFIDKISKLKLLGILTKAPAGEHVKNANVNIIRTNHIKMRCDKEIGLNIDGELLCASKFDLKIKKQAIKVYNDPSLVKDIING